MDRVPLLLLVLLVGCGGGVTEKDLVGKWTGGASMTYAAMQGDAGGESEQAQFLADQEGQDKSISLDLQEGGKAVFQAYQPLEGTWTLDDGTVVLTLPKFEADGPTFGGVYRLALEGKDKMSGADPNVAGYTLTFRK
jgi:hypothetical protein